ncbi:dihydroorotate dehydrogenase electron transfer subunit [Cupriavidus necator]|uniref:dihydroorotate dehydrogenase electron transfer subunit n=1 Tax=Cupriavidus necator TaxID=106590 RepID=UPI00278B7B97|nr:dihydroorotate dehydrogenase electron transfer subunit [Cupriavidus necator]MDQ0142065.1 dihydroorotate dehydrogenase electron transfer subunit [Cupriavidus necator]
MCATVCSAESAATVASYRCRIVEHYWVNQRYKYIRLESDAPLAPITRPGQFYQLNCPATTEAQPFLLRPMSVYGAGPEAGRIEFLYNVTGVGTRAMATLPVDGHMDIVGPLGNTFTFAPSFRRVLLVARGVGLATMAPLVHQAAEAGAGITAVMSARTPGDLMEKEFLRGATAEVHSVFDSDGTSSVEAVEALLRRILAEQRPDAVYTCGSHRLLMLLQRVLQDHPAVLAEVAMEQRMACGMGVCLSCVRMFNCDGDKQFLRVCREGPVFRIREVVGEVEFG